MNKMGQMSPLEIRNLILCAVICVSIDAAFSDLIINLFSSKSSSSIYNLFDTLDARIYSNISSFCSRKLADPFPLLLSVDIYLLVPFLV